VNCIRAVPGARKPRTAGFTLVEVLVALAIVSVALMAALRIAGQGTVQAGDLRARLLAGWVAENRLAEHAARAAWLPTGIARGSELQGGIEFGWREETIGTPHPDFHRVDVFVFLLPDESHVLAHFTSYSVNPPEPNQ
jgi:general secretion pathway protein I